MRHPFANPQPSTLVLYQHDVLAGCSFLTVRPPLYYSVWHTPRHSYYLDVSNALQQLVVNPNTNTANTTEISTSGVRHTQLCHSNCTQRHTEIVTTILRLPTSGGRRI